MMNGKIWSIDVDRADPSRAAVTKVEMGEADCVAFAVERFALTANVLTYAATGNDYGYWSLYPAAGDRGRVPVWGYATGRGPEDGRDISIFGLLPMASRVSLDLRATRGGWREVSETRALLNPVYNRYSSAEGTIKQRDANMLYRPLLIAALVLEQWLREEARFGADTILVTSASSKTALGFAMLARDHVAVIGMTAEARHEFVSDTGMYRAVLPYGQPVTHGGSVTIVDFAGDDRLIADLQQRLGDRCKRVVRIGRTHWHAPNTGDADRFFAPVQIERLVRLWGPVAFETHLAGAIERFDAVSAAWFRKRYLDGPDAILAGYRKLAAGAVDPTALLIARPQGDPH
jgi:hypothetical protein